MLQFVNPALLIGSALLAVPLIIHLLNRQRFRRRQWAAMEFLLAAYRKQRRRLRRENLILLLLRCLIPVMLALAVARPLFRDAAGFGGTDGPTHHVLVFDQSYSMNLQLAGGGTPFDRARNLASELLDRIDDEGGVARVSLVVQGLRTTTTLRETVDLQRAKVRVANLEEPVDGGADLVAALNAAAELVEESSAPEQRVHLFTDLQLRAFGDDLAAAAEPGLDTDATGRDAADAGDDPAAPDDAAAAGETDPQQPTDTADLFADTAPEAVRRIRERALLTVFDVRGASGQRTDVHPNVQITELRLSQGHAIRNLTLPVVATVRNRSPETRNLQLTLTVDDGQPTRRSVEVDAGAEVQVEFDTSFQELGQRRLQVVTDGDDLPNDDIRNAVVEVRERIRVLVIDDALNADVENDPELLQSTHVVEVLDPTGGEGPPDLTWFDPQVVFKGDFMAGRVNPADFDLVILANLDKLGDSRSADQLVEAVRGGTGLLAMLGQGIDATSYNVGLHRGGNGPMPLPLIDGRGRGFEPGGANHYGTLVELRDHPVFSDFLDDVQFDLLESVPVFRYLPTDRRELETSDDGGVEAAAETETEAAEGPRARVLWSVRDATRSPLMISSRFGAGKALFLYSPISRRPDRWNRLDTTFAGLSFMLLWPAAQWLTLPALDPHNVLAGQELSALLRERPTNLAVIPPETAGAAKIPVAEEATAQSGGRYALPPFRRTDHAGFYVYEMTLGADQGSGLDRAELFAVNPDPAEGQLDYLSYERARELLGVDRVVADLPDSASAAVDASVDEIGPMLLWATLLILLAETMMARFVSRGRS